MLAKCKVCGIVCKSDFRGLCSFHAEQPKPKEEFDWRKHY
jgi:hypothetical protein